MKQLLCLLIGMIILPTAASAHDSQTWATKVKLPEGEVATVLFDGHSFGGWQGLTDKYWSIDDGVIVGRNDEPNPASTYLLTKKPYRHFRLLLEVKQTLGPEYSTMHSAVCCLGEVIEDKDQPFGFRGPLLMFCHDWGIWDAHRRNRIYPKNHRGNYRPGVEQTGQWNQIEILVTDNRIRMVAGGKLVIDMTDQAEMLRASPIGLQLHGNAKPQEYRFRGLVLSENPQDTLVTLTSPDGQD